MPEGSASTRAVAAKNRQRDQAKRATRELFFSKAPYEDNYPFEISGQRFDLLMRSIGRKRYDELLTASPATPQQRAEGAPMNQDKFAPALLAEVVVDPAMPVEDWIAIWNDPNWNRGELGDLYFKAVDVCSHTNLSPDPTGNGSGPTGTSS